MQQRESPRELARGKWAGLLGQWLDDRTLAGRHGPCPMCAGKDRFRFDDLEGAGTWICSHCGAGDGFHLLQNVQGCDFAGAARYVEERIGTIVAKPSAPGRSTEDIKEALQKAWTGARRVERGDPVATYLESRCGPLSSFPACLRFHPALLHVNGNGARTEHPAMLAQVLGADGKGITIHRTWLTADGKKAPVDVAKKLMTPTSKMGNVAIRLAPVVDGWLGVAEGLETALAAAAKDRVPVWSCVSAGLLVKFRPPAGVNLLVIYGDNDRSFTGQAAAYELARAVTVLGIECRVLIPEEEGTDWADVHAEVRDAAKHHAIGAVRA